MCKKVGDDSAVGSVTTDVVVLLEDCVSSCILSRLLGRRNRELR